MSEKAQSVRQASPLARSLYIRWLYTHYKRAKVYLYESHVWLGLITYGGIILSFIKTVGAEQRPEECEHVYKRFLCMCINVGVCVCVCEQARSASVHQKIHLELI